MYAIKLNLQPRPKADQIMADTTAVQPSESPTKIEWKTFLEMHPPESTVEVINAVGNPYHSGVFPVRKIPLQLYCDSEECEGTHWFDHTEGDVHLEDEKWGKGILVYRCRHCQRSAKVFGLYVHMVLKDEKVVTAYKIGEFPPFGPPTPSRVITLIGEDRELFLKGRKAEIRGLGIGAFAYYRRVVENQKNRIIDEMEKVARKIGAKPEALAKFEAAKKETRFSESVDAFKDAIPESLLIVGRNPLKLLHTALSEGLHSQDDTACLELAQSIRLVLTDLAERMSLALKEQKELTGAVSRILQQNAKKDQSTN